MNKRLTTARDLWTHMTTQGGLQPEAWDDELVSALREDLCLGDGHFADELDARAITIERLAMSLLGQIGPFTSMMSDLLTLLAQHGVKETDDRAEIVFDFGAERERLGFDLEDFRRTQVVWERAMAPAIDANWLAANAIPLVDLLEAASDPPFDVWNSPAGAWDADYRAGRRWPPAHPTMPATGDAELDHELRRVSAVWAALIGEFSGRAPTRDGLDDIMAMSDPFAQTVASWEHDFFLRRMWQAILRLADPTQRTADFATLAGDLAAYFEDRPYRLVLSTVPVDRLLDLLDLPVWKRRHELYAAWVLTEIVAAVPERADVRLVHAAPGVLKFPFAPTRMAEIGGSEEPVVIWSELRSPLTDPVGKGRENNIQPDYTILAGSETAEDSVLEIECKQYKKPATTSFANALTDYARGRPKAHVVLVSHGPLTEAAVRAKVKDDVRDRTAAIGHLHPHGAKARERFRDIVGGQLEPLYPEPVLRCQLGWKDAPTDLDLHLWIDVAGEKTHVSYEEPGTLEGPPFAHLLEDVVEPGGLEEIVVRHLVEDAKYHIVVHNFSDDEPLAGSQAVVLLLRAGQDRIAVAPPPFGGGRWWHVATIRPNVPGAEMSIINRLFDRSSPPWD
jgi:hypothetical protein